MSFNYNKNKHDDHGSFWTSYSDLLLGLSVVFLLLYVTASLRVSTNGMQQQIENQKLTMQVEDLKNQLKMYDSVKKDYLEKSATEDEEQQYTELMDKLTLLQEEARDEKNSLRKAAQENEKKEAALNKYQQLVRNIINANVMSKTKIKSRDTIITDQDVTIDDQKEEISGLQTVVKQKEGQIAQNQQKILETEEALNKKLKELKYAYNNNKMTKKNYEQQMANLKNEANSKIESLEEKAEAFRGELNAAKNQMAALSGELASTKGQLDTTKGVLQKTKGDLEQTKGALSSTKGALEQAKGELDQTMGALSNAKGALAQTQGELEKTKGEAAGLGAKLKDAQGNLGKLQAELDARKNVANEIKKAFAAAGVKADVDGETGDVVLDFGSHYFDNNSARLKNGMMDVLEKAMPAYARSLMGNKKISNKITSIEIVGFASPTYKGKFIDPNSTDIADKKAIEYNMDLSYDRAKSIFNYTFEEKNMKFDHQKQMLPLVKVSARSFLELFDNKRKPSSSDDFCKMNDCSKARKVMIKFTMDPKK